MEQKRERSRSEDSILSAESGSGPEPQIIHYIGSLCLT